MNIFICVLSAILAVLFWWLALTLPFIQMTGPVNIAIFLTCVSYHFYNKVPYDRHNDVKDSET